MIYIQIFNKEVGVFDPNYLDYKGSQLPISSSKIMSVFKSMLHSSYIDELEQLNFSNRNNEEARITLTFSATSGQHGALGQINGKFTLKEPVIPLDFDITLGIVNETEYGYTEVYIPWNYSPINGTDNRVLIPVIKELISLYTEHLRELIQADKDRVKQKKEIEKQKELEKLETLAKKYGKTLV